MKFIISLLILVSCSLHAQREIQSLNGHWKFYLGDEPKASLSEFDDSAWKAANIPHDWSFEAGVSEDGAQKDKGGYYSGGIGWYRTTFDVPTLSPDRKTSIEFDGVYMNSEVWINGNKLGKFPYGYLSFRYDLTPHLKKGPNTLSVRCDNSLEPSARWYHPCGIYAPVRLVTTNQTHIAKDGIHITTPEITSSRATVSIKTKVEGGQAASVEHIILDPAGKQVATTASESVTINNPQRWDVQTPALYTLVTRLSQNGKVIDEVKTRFGIRTIAWKAETGFWLNGRNVKLLGVCEHWEGGPVGGAWTPDLMRWKIMTLKSMGCNAIRTAHNPCPSFFYDLCDELGMLVMDEMFDGWKKKAPYDYGQQAFEQHWEKDLRSWLKRDRNHPSIVIWSVGNETRGPVAPDLVKVCHELDATRPVTSGHSGSQHMDVFGVNGHSESPSFYTGHHRPTDKAFIATEAPHTWQVRGYYRSKTWFRDGFKAQKQRSFPLKDLTPTEIFTYSWTAPANQKNRKQIFNSSYDNAMVRITARKNWELMRDLPWYSGHFRWTGFDYPGEAGYVHGGWPFRAFMGGSHDLAGFPKDLAYFYQSQWTTEPMVHLLPHWTHPKMKPGTLIPVWAYSNADEVELLLNGKSLGKDKPGKTAYEMQCEWMVPWTPGTLTAIAYRNGKEVARTSQTTASAPASFALQNERHGNACIVTTTLTDKHGTHTPYADNRVHYHLSGKGRILSHENGDPVDTENGVTNSSRRAFMGKTRSFIELADSEPATTLTAAAILGSRNGVTAGSESIQVHITSGVQVLSGNTGNTTSEDNDTIHFTTDGSVPTASSPTYQEAINVTLPTTVKALVIRDGQPLFQMEETFATDQGLYWQKENEKPLVVTDSGMQAESAKLSGSAKISTQGKGFQGKGCVDLPRQGSTITWYQENDGSAGKFTLSFRFANGDPKGPRKADLVINGKKIKTISFPKTGSWNSDWKTLMLNARLQAGANEISLKASGKGGPSIDALLIE